MIILTVLKTDNQIVGWQNNPYITDLYEPEPEVYFIETDEETLAKIQPLQIDVKTDDGHTIIERPYWENGSVVWKPEPTE